MAHAGALGWLALRVVPKPTSAPASPPDFEVVLDRPAASPAATSPSASRRAPAPPASEISAAARPTAAAAPPASAPSASAPSPPPAATGSAAGLVGRTPDAAPGGAVAGAGPAAADMRGLLREALGCAHAQLMDFSPAERARCAERLGLASRTAPRFDPIPAEKRAYYDAVAAAYAQARAPPGSVPTGFAGVPRAGLLADTGGLYIPLPVCALRFGAPRGWKSYHDVPPHSLKLGKLGKLSCFIAPPSGRGFEESGVEAPASLRERTDDAAHMKALDAPKP